LQVSLSQTRSVESPVDNRISKRESLDFPLWKRIPKLEAANKELFAELSQGVLSFLSQIAVRTSAARSTLALNPVTKQRSSHHEQRATVHQAAEARQPR
jgi:regulator of sirC expression with transglutaminase-like and TPR domain